jgi:hypothetical protein
MQAEIRFVERKRPNYVVVSGVSWNSRSSFGTLLINLKTLELLMKSLEVKSIRDFKEGRIFDTNYSEPREALEDFLRSHYPKERGIKISLYTKREPKYDPDVWKIIRVEPNVRHLLFKQEENYWAVVVEGHPKGYVFPCTRGTAYLRGETLALVMEHFGVKKPKNLVGKEFRANVHDAQAALLVIAIKAKYPKLI